MLKNITKNGTSIIVGENANENDYITCKYSEEKNPGILWFHANKIPGSHVILIPDELNGYTNEDIQTAADYAATHSKNNGVKELKVCYCKAMDVIKLKGSNPGEVVIKNEKYIKGYNLKN